ncbi:MAG: hypothetical protein IJB77_05285 [Bacteroidaceae bacterium]|nr:hypothetical protein [Bacteroidaceae bacterium]
MRTIKITLNALFLLALTLFHSSCTQKIYQIYEVESVNLQSSDKEIIFSNNDCEISYNLWSATGNLDFLFKNKTEHDIYIDMTRSFFIRNGIAYDYYNDIEYTRTTTTMTSTSAAASLIMKNKDYYTTLWAPSNAIREIKVSAGQNIGAARSVTEKEAKYICIPAKSAKEIKGFNISDYIYYECGNNKFNFPSKKSETITYTKEKSPLTFRNRITYFFDSNISNSIDNEFWIKSLTNYKQNEVVENVRAKNCIGSGETTKRVNKQKAANKFYNTYENTGGY